MKKFIALVIVAFFSITNFSNASDCNNVQSQLKKNECAALTSEEQDKKLNEVYKKLQSILDVEKKNKLKEAQLAWLKYRDLDCEQEGERYKNGSLYSYIISDCHMAKAIIRTEELSRLIRLHEEM